MSGILNSKTIVVVGLGRIASAHADALRSLGADIVGVETNAEARAHWARQGVTVYDDVDRALREADVDGAVVCTPPHVREAVVDPLLKAEIPVLIEKPLARSSAESAAVMSLVEERSARVTTASKFNAMESVALASAWIEDGRIGSVVDIHIVFAGELDISGDWRARPEQGAGGVWMDNGPHAIDVASRLAGPVRQARWEAGAARQQTAVEDECRVRLRHETDVETIVELTWNETRRAPIAAVRGCHGEIDVGWQELVLRARDGVTRMAAGYDKARCFRSIARQFFATGSKSAASPASGHHALTVIEAAYLSRVQGGAWVRVRG